MFIILWNEEGEDIGHGNNILLERYMVTDSMASLKEEMKSINSPFNTKKNGRYFESAEILAGAKAKG